MEPSLSYESAYEELRTITAEIEAETVSVDVLAEKVRRASDLITHCLLKLRATETEVNKIIVQMEGGAKQ